MTCTLVANGALVLDPLPLAIAWGVCEILIDTRRTVPPIAWIDWVRDTQRQDQHANLL
jgi:hypothetical protein